MNITAVIDLEMTVGIAAKKKKNRVSITFSLSANVFGPFQAETTQYFDVPLRLNL